MLASMKYRGGVGALLIWLLAVLTALAGCGGGGGGSNSGGAVQVRGRVLLAETGSAPNPPATVAIGGGTGTTNTDGTFAVNSSAGSVTLTITASGSQTLTQTVTLAAGSGTVELGDLFLSNTGYTANLTARIVTDASGQTQPVGNATVTIAGKTVQSGTDGTISIQNLPVGLGSTTGQVVGSIAASGFETRTITSETLQFPLEAGANAIGDILITAPAGSTPNPPYTITGRVTVNGQAPGTGQTVTVFIAPQGGVALNPPATADANGNYFFWVVPGTYTITAQVGITGGQQTVTLQNTATPQQVQTIDLNP